MYMDWVKDLTQVSDFAMGNGLYLIEIGDKLLIMVLEDKLMVIIHFICKDKNQDYFILTTLDHQMQWM